MAEEPTSFSSSMLTATTTSHTATSGTSTTQASFHKHHQHHQHRRAMPLKRDNTLPTLSTLPQLTTLTQEPSPTYSVGIPAGDHATNGYSKNPYISESTLPQGLLFIIFGSIIAAILAGCIIYRVIMYIIHNLKARNEKEVYYHNFNNHILWGGDNSTIDFTSCSSINLEKNHSSNSSLFKLSNNSYDMSTLIDTNPGRSYRESIIGTKADSKSNRNSMFISPVLDIMAQKNNSDLTLPLYHKPMFANSSIGSSFTLPLGSDIDDNMSNMDLMANTHNTSDNTSPDNSSPDNTSPDNIPSDNASHLNATIQSEMKKSPQINNLYDMKTTKSRPPSQYLEDLLNDI